jgi:hypothetical protein
VIWKGYFITSSCHPVLGPQLIFSITGQSGLKGPFTTLKQINVIHAISNPQTLAHSNLKLSDPSWNIPNATASLSFESNVYSRRGQPFWNRGPHSKICGFFMTIIFDEFLTIFHYVGLCQDDW